MKPYKELSESQFYMWRTLFAVAHADNVVSIEEVRFMAEALEDIPFSEVQKKILNEDLKDPRDPEEMFAGITDDRDQALFFKHASALVHVDGRFGEEEQNIIVKLQKKHLKTVNVDSLVGRIDLEFQDEDKTPTLEPQKSSSLKESLLAFKALFARN
jgi:hypothetical protein